MVDPSLVTLGFTPFLLIRGLSRAASIHHCLEVLTTPNFSRVDALDVELEEQASWTRPAEEEPDVVPWSVGVGLVSGVNCVDLLSPWINDNSSTWQEGSLLERPLEEHIENLLVKTPIENFEMKN